MHFFGQTLSTTASFSGLTFVDDMALLSIQISQDNVEFAGFEITSDTVCPCKRYLRVSCP